MIKTIKREGFATMSPRHHRRRLLKVKEQMQNEGNFGSERELASAFAWGTRDNALFIIVLILTWLSRGAESRAKGK